MNTLTPLPIQPLRPSELASATPKPLSWLWDGYLAPGKVSTLISPPKSGKTTLLSRLLARLGAGGTLAGRAVSSGRAIVVSEESASDWDARCRQLAIGPNVQFLCRPFQGARPTDDQWYALIASLEALHREEPLNLVVLDALAALLPGYAETCAPKMLDCLLPLQALANLGPAVWLLHHPTKGKRIDGQAARGSGALLGFADILMEMSCYRRARSSDRRRRICAYSRYAETPRQQIVELTADGADYVVYEPDKKEVGEGARTHPWPEVEERLANTYQKLTQQDILEQWPDDSTRPSRFKLSRWLNRAVQRNALCCAGAGHLGDAKRYWLPDREPLLFPGHGAGKEAIEEWKERCAADTHVRMRRQLGME